VPHRRQAASEAVEYRGPDRRRHVEAASGVKAVRPAVAIVVIAVLWVVAAAALGEGMPGWGSAALRTRLEIAGGALALFAGGICLLRRHLEGSAPALSLGAGLVVLSLPGIALVAPGSRADETTAAALAALWVGGVHFARAIRVPQVETASSPAVVAAATAGGLAVAFVVAAAVVVWGPVVVAEVATGLAYGALAVATARRMQHAGFADGSWLISVLAAVACATTMWALTPAGAGLLALGAGLLRCAAFGLAAAGSVGVLSVSAARHRSQAFRSRVDHAEEAELRRQLEADYADQLHEVRSSVLALHGGVRTLEPAAAADARLARALEAELARLQELVAPHDRGVAGIAFSVEEALVPTLRVGEAAGWPVAWRIPAGLCAIGRPAHCAQVVHALVANAHRHARGTPIDVSASRKGEHVLIRVEDRGPGVARGCREQIFERGCRADQEGEGQGLGLAVARRLCREQGGDLWVEARPGGGAAFVITLDAGDRRRTMPRPAPADGLRLV
jgi:signal transduction histidine kinase